MNLTIRNESTEDIETITELTAAAFAQQAHSSHTEHFISQHQGARAKIAKAIADCLNQR